ncbi:hypothetical protein PDE_04379 [Penicillium oxalicum 114-2]|uniref:Uncharacterized protein n=1 Tax=Penicillium oxalicum (strain 114-2 / CGMCC 5302) TaxID=933388 RepID=S7ZFI3_PENO1|nr:hypothetical protein PDE_04379 [Penicillium oxalicum 114-2]
MATLEKLPSEILFSINAHAADWIGLESLLQVLPSIGELFAGDANTTADPEAIRLVESILKENSVMKYELHCQFRMALNLRQPHLTDASVAEFMARDHSSSLLDTSPVSALVLKEMVIVAANIQRLACACLTTFLDRVRKVQPLRWERLRARGLEGPEPYQPGDTGPFTWIEEYRVYRALWNMQLYSDLSVAAGQLNWPQSDIDQWQTESTKWTSRGSHMKGELRSISECLNFMLGLDPVPLRVNPTDVFHDLIDQPPNVQLPNVSQLRCKFDCWGPPSLSKDLESEEYCFSLDHWGNGISAASSIRSTGCFMLCQHMRLRNHPRHPDLVVQDNRLWRALGMHIWDQWRLYRLGVWYPRFVRGNRHGPVPAPDGSEVPQELYPFPLGTEYDSGFSFFIQALRQLETQEHEQRLAGVEV